MAIILPTPASMHLQRKNGKAYIQLPWHPNNILCTNIFPVLTDLAIGVEKGEAITVECWTPNRTLKVTGKILGCWCWETLDTVPEGFLQLISGEENGQALIHRYLKYFQGRKDPSISPARVLLIAREFPIVRHFI
ncbi:MAG: hypothetical protein AAGI38_01290 [Bacteroidota bacterium]